MATPKDIASARAESARLEFAEFALRIEWRFDDTGCVVEARRCDRLVETGIAFHEGRGQADSLRRAIRDLHNRIGAKNRLGLSVTTTDRGVECRVTR